MRTPVPAARVARIGMGLCRALAGAHAMGVPHPRLRAECVMVRDDDSVSVTDASRKLEPIALSALAPELRRGRPPSIASDIYAIGVLLYECLTGRLPGELTVPPSARAKCPPAMDAVVMRALDPDPDERFLSVKSLEHALKDISFSEAVTATSIFVGLPKTLEEPAFDEQQTLILQVVARVRRLPRLLLCAALLALLVEGTIAPACSGTRVTVTYSPAWPR